MNTTEKQKQATRARQDKVLYLPVEKVPTADILPNHLTNSYNSHSIVTKSEGGDKILAMVSENYGLLENREMFPEVEKSLDGLYVYDRHVKTEDDARFFVDYEIKDEKYNFGLFSGKDALYPMFRLQKSYNGTAGFRFMKGLKRKVCDNGMMAIASPHQLDISLRHMEGNIEGLVKKVLAGIADYLQNCFEQSKLYKGMADVVVADPVERIKEVCEETGILKSYQEDIVNRVRVEQETFDVPASDWLIYNAFNYQFNHNDRLHTNQVDFVAFDRKVFDFISAPVKTAIA